MESKLFTSKIILRQLIKHYLFKLKSGNIKANRLSDLFISPNGKTLFGISASSYKIFVIDIKSKKIKNR